jgi:hypothetical protein
MRTATVETRWILALVAALALALGACDDEEDDGNGDTGGGGDTVEDTGGGGDMAGDTGMGDMAGDTGMGDMSMGDMSMGDMSMGDAVEDAVAAIDLCVNDTDTPLVGGEDGTMRSALGVAVPVCARVSCLACASNPECDLPACVSTCIADYEDGDQEDPDVDAAIQAVRDSGLTDGCMGCYAGITACVVRGGGVVAGGCAFGAPGCAVDNGTCACLECQCEAGCGETFTECSGLPTYLDCPVTEDADGNVCE